MSDPGSTACTRSGRRTQSGGFGTDSNESLRRYVLDKPTQEPKPWTVVESFEQKSGSSTRSRGSNFRASDGTAESISDKRFQSDNLPLEEEAVMDESSSSMSWVERKALRAKPRERESSRNWDSDEMFPGESAATVEAWSKNQKEARRLLTDSHVSHQGEESDSYSNGEPENEDQENPQSGGHGTEEDGIEGSTERMRYGGNCSDEN